jgi:hypothetical protein
VAGAQDGERVFRRKRKERKKKYLKMKCNILD